MDDLIYENPWCKSEGQDQDKRTHNVYTWQGVIAMFSRAFAGVSIHKRLDQSSATTTNHFLPEVAEINKIAKLLPALQKVCCGITLQLR